MFQAILSLIIRSI